MKAISMFAAGLFFLIAAAAQNYQWPEEFLSGNVVNAICFSGSENGHAVGGFFEPDGQSHGIILRTEDGGMTWDKLGTNFYLHSVFFMNETRGYAIGEYLLRTTNSGDDWQIVSRLDQEYVQDVLTFPEDLQGYIIGENNHAVRKPADQGPYGSDEKPDGSCLRLFPNPATSFITVETTGDPSGQIISILDLKGEIVLMQSAPAPKTVLDVSDLPSGYYVIRIGGKGREFVRKFFRK